MKKRYPFSLKNWLRSALLTVFAFSVVFSLQAQIAPIKLWDKAFGGSGNDALYAMQQTSDGGYILGGGSTSPLSGDKTQAAYGQGDYWVVKTDANGNKMWDKSFGGSDNDILRALKQTSDGGYILGGYSLSGISGDKSQASRGNYDFWIIKLDANGNKIWDKTIGGCCDDKLYDLQQTSDGGYILGGSSKSTIGGDKSQPNRGPVNPLTYDYWVVKLDANGNKSWDKVFGGIENDELNSLQQTSDGGYILGGTTPSGLGGDKSQPSYGTWDYWVIKINGNGNKVWDKSFGGNNWDYLHALQQTADGGYILGGLSGSGITGNKTEASKGFFDFWIIKLDVNGNKTWDRSIGGSNNDELYALRQTLDGGYIMGGSSQSDISGDKSEDNKGVGNTADFWVVKTDANGTISWDKTIGGTNHDLLYDLQQTPDGNYIIAGPSTSGIGADKSQASVGSYDYWAVKLVPLCYPFTATLSTTCNTNGSTVNVNIAGIPPSTTGTPSWILHYTVNGASQTASGSSSTFTLAQNINTPTVYTLVSIVSGICTKNLADSLIIQPIPAALAVTPGSNCGTGPVTLSATGAPGGGSYVWYDSATAGTALYTDPSGIFTSPSISTTTTYYVAAATITGCEGPRTPVTATIYTQPVVQAGASQTVCSNATPTQLTGFSPAGGTWSGPGVNTAGIFTPTNNLSGNQTLTYSFTQNGCTVSDTLTVTVIAAPAVTVGSNIAICSNAAPLRLTGFSPSGGTWSGPGIDSTGLFTPVTSLIGNQTLTYTITQNGCTTSAIRMITVTALPAQPVITLTPNDTLISSVTGNSYEWTFNGNTLPDNTQKLKATASGTYAVRVNNGNNCSSAFSTNYNYQISGIAEALPQGFGLYPNPGSGTFYLELKGHPAAQVKVFNSLGQLVLNKTVSKNDQNKPVPLNLTSVAKGIYLIQVETTKAVIVKKLVIQ